MLVAYVRIRAGEAPGEEDWLDKYCYCCRDTKVVRREKKRIATELKWKLRREAEAEAEMIRLEKLTGLSRQ